MKQQKISALEDRDSLHSSVLVKAGIPQIVTELDLSIPGTNHSIYITAIENNLKRILPKKFFDLYLSELSKKGEIQEYFQKILPAAHAVISVKDPFNLSYLILFRCRTNAFKFCFEMMSRWLVPGKRLNVVLVNTVDFSLPEISPDLYTIFEVVLRLESKEELDEVQRNLPSIESEISLGVSSAYYARKILEVKGLSNDEKTAMIQEYVAYMIRRRSNDFSYDVFGEMQHVLVVCRDEFKAAREVRHLSRIICVQYLFYRALKKAVMTFPGKRHLFLKIYKAVIRTRNLKKNVLALMVGFNFINDKEIFGETHFVRAIRNYIPKAEVVSNSYFCNRRDQESICTLYIEIEKNGGEDFSREEIDLLKKELAGDLEGRIMHLMHPIFMPRNEEEVMRNILALGQQIKFVRDNPQIFITFDEQTSFYLYFTVILVRVTHAGSPTVQELFKRSDAAVEYIQDRSKIIGALRKKYKKEAVVFRLRVPKESFLRRDHSIDLYKARQSVVNEISKALGEVRDYNGGMISKQNELLNSVKELLKHSKKNNDFLLENFFYALNPVVMRTLLEPEALKELFIMVLDTIKAAAHEPQKQMIRIQEKPSAVFAVLNVLNRKAEKEIQAKLSALNLSAGSLASSYLCVQEILFWGYIYRSEDVKKRQLFCEIINEQCQRNRESQSDRE